MQQVKANEIIQLKIKLKGSKPPIWRRIQVERSASFLQLHRIIQLVMGWTDSHLHEFCINGEFITEKDKDIFNGLIENDFDDTFDDGFGKGYYDSSKITLESLIDSEKQKFIYTYDFGDDWEHEIVVEKFLPRENTLQYPRCIDGKLNCPPEDCGGIWGFYKLLEII